MTGLRRLTGVLGRAGLGVLALLLLVPLASIVLSWLDLFAPSSESPSILLNMLQTVLPHYASETLVLCALVAVIAGVMGTTSAVLVTVFDFKSRAVWEWALLLPLAMPAYVVAYAYTDFLQYSGALQNALRDTLGLQGRVLPDIRNVWGAALVFAFALSPYVYLMVRTALHERAAHLLEAARLLGSPLHERMWRVALPLARPAVAAGVVLVLMETLADYGVVSYFGVQTFTSGVYKAWLAMDNRMAAAQLATMLLLTVLLLLKVEHHAQKRMRFVSNKTSASGTQATSPVHLTGGTALLAAILCALPVLLGFVCPVLIMLHELWMQWQAQDVVLPWATFGLWAWNSLRLAAITSALAVTLAMGLSFAMRVNTHPWVHRVGQLTALGYAAPGAVIVVGLLLPLGWLQSQMPQWDIGYWLTVTSVGLVWAYLVRFNAVALQSLQSGYSRIPLNLDESTSMLGGQPWTLWRQVHWPMLRPSVLTAALLVFVDVMKELPATLVLRPFNSDTLAVVTYQLARDERLGEAALPALALVLVGLLPVYWLSRQMRRLR